MRWLPSIATFFRHSRAWNPLLLPFFFALSHFIASGIHRGFDYFLESSELHCHLFINYISEERIWFWHKYPLIQRLPRNTFMISSWIHLLTICVCVCVCVGGGGGEQRARSDASRPEDLLQAICKTIFNIGTPIPCVSNWHRPLQPYCNPRCNPVTVCTVLWSLCCSNMRNANPLGPSMQIFALLTNTHTNLWISLYTDCRNWPVHCFNMLLLSHC